MPPAARPAVTDAWEDVRHKVAALFGRAEPGERAGDRLARTRAAVEAAPPADAGRVRAEQAALWTARIVVLLDDHPEAADAVRSLLTQLGATAPAARDHSVAAGRDVLIKGDRGGAGVGVLHGNLTMPGPGSPAPEAPPDPTMPGPASG